MLKTITAAYINQPKPGKKWGNIKSDSGEVYFAAWEKIRNVGSGNNVEGDYQDKSFLDGKAYKYLDSVRILGSISNSVVQANGNPAPYAGGGSVQSMHIFVTGVVGRAMGSGKFAASDMVELTKNAMTAWSVLSAPEVTRPATTKDLDDEIPF